MDWEGVWVGTKVPDWRASAMSIPCTKTCMDLRGPIQEMKMTVATWTFYHKRMTYKRAIWLKLCIPQLLSCSKTLNKTYSRKKKDLLSLFTSEIQATSTSKITICLLMEFLNFPHCFWDTIFHSKPTLSQDCNASHILHPPHSSFNKTLNVPAKTLFLHLISNIS